MRKAAAWSAQRWPCGCEHKAQWSAFGGAGKSLSAAAQDSMRGWKTFHARMNSAPSPHGIVSIPAWSTTEKAAAKRHWPAPITQKASKTIETCYYCAEKNVILQAIRLSIHPSVAKHKERISYEGFLAYHPARATPPGSRPVGVVLHCFCPPAVGPVLHHVYGPGPSHEPAHRHC